MRLLSSRRFFEILPGVFTWTALLLPFFLAFFWPSFLAIVFLVYALYWLVKSLLMSGHLIAGYLAFRQDEKIDWWEKLKKLSPKEDYLSLYHLIFVPTYKEELSILKETFRSIERSHYPQEKIIVVLAGEERDETRAKENFKALKKEFGKSFYDFLFFLHPAATPGEVKGKGANISFAGKKVKKYLEKEKIPFENIIVTTLDADNRLDPQYLACLTYKYLTTDDPVHKSFQPLPMYFNNIWQVPLPIRMVAMGGSFWQMIEATRPHRLRNFSSHAQSFKTLVDTNFWSTTTIVEDGHQFWRTYFRYNGDHKVIPLFLPIYQDAVLGKTLFETLKEQYLQKRRWAWGVSDIPYVLEHNLKDSRLPFWDKWVKFFRLVEGHFTWATISLHLALVGWLPVLLNVSFRETVLAFNFPFYYSRLLTIASVGMVVTLTLSTLLLPPRPAHQRFKKIRTLVDWILTPLLIPVTNICFGSFPAIDSQTRLMLGKYLEFRVTPKIAAPSTTGHVLASR